MSAAWAVCDPPGLPLSALSLVVDADAADEYAAVAERPLAKLVHLLVVDYELRAALRADDRETAIAARLAPLEHVTEGMAVALAEVREDVLDTETERERGIGNAD